MVQICSSCNERHNHLAEGGSNVSVHGESGNLGNGNRCLTPSDNKSQANSESSCVKFKVGEILLIFILLLLLIDLNTTIEQILSIFSLTKRCLCLHQLVTPRNYEKIQDQIRQLIKELPKMDTDCIRKKNAV